MYTEIKPSAHRLRPASERLGILNPVPRIQTPKVIEKPKALNPLSLSAKLNPEAEQHLNPNLESTH